MLILKLYILYDFGLIFSVNFSADLLQYNFLKASIVFSKTIVCQHSTNNPSIES